MFSKRTIRQKISVTSVDTASEALALSLAEKAKVDMPYMMELTHKSEEEILSDLKGVIFLNPEHDGNEDVAHKYLPADEYLSGNVREKLRGCRPRLCGILSLSFCGHLTIRGGTSRCITAPTPASGM